VWCSNRCKGGSVHQLKGFQRSGPESLSHSVSEFASGTFQRRWLRSSHARFGSSLAGLLLCCRYMMVAGKKALGDSGLHWEGPELKDLNRQRCGILIGVPRWRLCLLLALGGLGTDGLADRLQPPARPAGRQGPKPRPPFLSAAARCAPGAHLTHTPARKIPCTLPATFVPLPFPLRSRQAPPWAAWPPLPRRWSRCARATRR
jgi:hypothetical protein